MKHSAIDEKLAAAMHAARGEASLRALTKDWPFAYFTRALRLTEHHRPTEMRSWLETIRAERKNPPSEVALRRRTLARREA